MALTTFWHRSRLLRFTVVSSLSLALPLALAMGSGLLAGGAPRQAPLSASIDEPELPDYLTIQPNPADPTLIDVEVADAVPGTAELNWTADAPMEMAGSAQGRRLQLEGKGGRNHYSLRSRAANPSQANRVRVNLTVRDAEGRAFLNITREADLGSPPARAAETPFHPIAGRSRDGEPVAASVPASAPVPVQEEAAQ